MDCVLFCVNNVTRKSVAFEQYDSKEAVYNNIMTENSVVFNNHIPRESV